MHQDAPRRPLLRRVSPPVVVGAGAGLVGLVLALGTALQLTSLVSLDEAVYKLSAAQYADGGLGAILRDDVARGTARLYSVVIAPLFGLFPGDVAVRAARMLTSVLWVLTAFPVYLLARRVTTTAWHAAAAALLSIAVPWATIGTVLFSEGLAYPLFATALLAMTAALREPTPRRDAAVLVVVGALVATRVQFAAVPFAWIAVVLALELPAARRASGSWRGALVALGRRRPVLFAAVALVVLAAGVLLVAGGGLQRLAGPYTEIRHRDTLPGDVTVAALFEAAMLALGTGLIPAVLAAMWWRDALRGRAGAEGFRLAVLGSAVLVALFGVTLAATNGWQGPDVTEERYYVYAVPLVFTAALAALGTDRVRARAIAWGGVALAALLALAPTTAGLSAERAFLVPVAATTTNVAGRVDEQLRTLLGMEHVISQRDLLVLLVAAVTLLAIVALRRARWAVLVPAVVLQLGFAGYAVATMHGRVPGVPGVTGTASFADLAWIDRADAGAATLLEDRLDAERADAVRLAFWNDEVRRTLRVEDVGQPRVPYPVSALPETSATVDPALAMTPAPGRTVVAVVDSPLLQIAGRRVAAAPGGSAVLLRPERPARATWLARGLGVNGQVAGPVTVTASAGSRVALTFRAPPEGPGGAVEVRLGGPARTATVEPGGSTVVRAGSCSASGVVAGTLAPAGAGAGAVRLVAVRITPC